MEIKLLKLLAIGHIAGGIGLWLLYFIEPLHIPLLQLVYDNQPEKLSNTQQLAFWLCILGPTIASWGLLFLALVHQYFITPTVFLWRCMMAAVLLWAPLDSTLCLLNDIYSGAIGNSVITIIFVLLLFRIRVSIWQSGVTPC